MITVVAPIKNREWKPTYEFIHSLRCQRERCKIILVDYGSDEEHLVWERRLCEQNDVRLVEVRYNTEPFNQSRAHNIGARLADTPYVIFTDADLKYNENVIAAAQEAFDEYDDMLLLCQRWDLDKKGKKIELHSRGAYGTFMGMRRDWFEKVRGFDEFYTGWGGFGVDLFDRAKQDGLSPMWLNVLDSTVEIHHQWHPGSPRDGMQDKAAYYERPDKPLVRNPDGWGTRQRPFEEMWAYTDDIFGAFTEDEGRRMYEVATTLPGRSVVVEIGAHWGRSTSLLGQIAMDNDLCLTTVDCFEPYPPDAWWSKDGSGLTHILPNIRTLGIDATVMMMRSEEAARRFTQGIDLLFVDGGHRFPEVQADCNNWLPKLKPGGWVLFHDYARHGHVGVKQAVDALEGYEDHGVAYSMRVLRKKT